MTIARRLAFALTLTAAGAAGTYRWVARSIDRACACIGRHGPIGEWREVDDLLADPFPRCLP